MDSKLEDKRFCTKWQQAFPDFSLLLISSWIEFCFVTAFRRHLKCSTLSKEFSHLHYINTKAALQYIIVLQYINYYNTVLYYNTVFTIQYCITIHQLLQYSIVLQYSIYYNTVLYYNTLFITIQYCTTIQYL